MKKITNNNTNKEQIKTSNWIPYNLISLEQGLLHGKFVYNTCKQRIVKLVNNETKCISIGQCWNFSFEKSRYTFVFNQKEYAMTLKKGYAYEIYRIAVLTFHSIGKRRSATKKLFSTLTDNSLLWEFIRKILLNL